MRPARLSSLYILAFSLIAPALWAAGQQKSKPDKPLEEWQSWSKFKEHIDESRKVDGGGIPVVTNGSLELAFALADGPIAPSELTDAAKRTGLGTEVEFSAIFKGTEALTDNQKKRYGSSVTLKFEDPFNGYFFSDPNEKEVSKWKATTPGSKVRWRATVSAIALWPISPDKPIYLITLRDAKIVDLGQASTSPPPAPNRAAPQDRTTASSEDWKRDPTAFVHLLIGDDLSLHPSAAGTPSVSVPDAVRQQIIGTRVTWTVIRRASPFPSGPQTLPTAAITHGNQVTGVLLLMARRFAGDTEVCEVPYQKIAIDTPVEISGKVASFKAGIRPDGQIVVVVEVTDVPGCQTGAPAPSVDISGRWEYKRTSAPNIKSDKGMMDLTLEASCDQDGFTCYTYYQPAGGQSDKSPPKKWTIALKGSQIIICIVNCSFSCFGVLTPEGQIKAPCKFIDMFAGEFTARRAK